MTDLIPKGRNDGHVFDFTKITDQIYLGSDLCKGGVCLLHGEEFRKIGVTFEINLSIENNELPPKDIEGYLWLPVIDGYAPSKSQLDVGTAFINEAVVNGKTVYVHCKNGHARSPSLIIAYLMKFKKMSYDDAQGFVKEKRSEIHIEESQKTVLQAYE